MSFTFKNRSEPINRLGFVVDTYDVAGLTTTDMKSYIDLVVKLKEKIPYLQYINVKQDSDHCSPKALLAYESYEQFKSAMLLNSGEDIVSFSIFGSNDTEEVVATINFGSSVVYISSRPKRNEQEHERYAWYNERGRTLCPVCYGIVTDRVCAKCLTMYDDWPLDASAIERIDKNTKRWRQKSKDMSSQ